MPTDLAKLERDVSAGRKKLDELWYERRAASVSGNEEKEWTVRHELGRIALDNCSQIATYVREADASIGNEIQEKVKMAAEELRELEQRRNLDELHRWYRDKLDPILNKAEQEARLLSEIRMKQEKA